MVKLTQRQRQVLELIANYIQQHGAPPTRAEIARELGFRSVNAAEDHLKALARKGVIEILPGLSRGLRLRQAQGLPIVGRLTVGNPILSEHHIEGYCPAEQVFHPKADFLLRVQGHGLRDAGILENDLLAVHKTQQVNNGQIVVVSLNKEVLIKRFERIGNVVRLLSANPDIHPITVDITQQSLEIEGVGVGVLRQFPITTSVREGD
jgi:repressor LexA